MKVVTYQGDTAQSSVRRVRINIKPHNMHNDPLIEEYVEKAFKRIENEVEYDATQWNGMLVWEAGDADKVYEILRTSLKEYGDKRVAGIEKAYGGCKECYGKGYFTEQKGKIGNGRITLRDPEIVMNYCKNCERGKQLKSLITQKQ